MEVGSSAHSARHAPITSFGSLPRLRVQLALVAVLASLAMTTACRKKRPDRQVTSIRAGVDQTCALTKDTRLRCWGDNHLGVFADPPSPAVPHPRSIDLPSPVHAVALGKEALCAIAGAERNVVCRGAPELVPRDAAGELRDATSIALGRVHGCAVVLGHVLCWGDNTFGQLGDGTYTSRLEPHVVPGLESVEEVAAGGAFTCARLTTGAVSCWGQNTDGQLGDESFETRNRPSSPVLPNAVRLDAGEAHACARIGEAEVRCWGRNAQGQLGDGTLARRPQPVTVRGVSGAVQLSLGGETSCARQADASLKCWGSNAFGQLGDSTTDNRNEPGLVFGVFDVVEVAVGENHVCARFKDGTMKCWGAGLNGQLGDGASANRRVPVGVRF